MTFSDFVDAFHQHRTRNPNARVQLGLSDGLGQLPDPTLGPAADDRTPAVSVDDEQPFIAPVRELDEIDPSLLPQIDEVRVEQERRQRTRARRRNWAIAVSRSLATTVSKPSNAQRICFWRAGSSSTMRRVRCLSTILLRHS